MNYRSKLWSREKACEVMSELVPYVDVLIANEEDAKDVFGIEAADTDVASGKINQMGYVSVAKQLTERFGCKAVSITLRGSISASENNWAGMLYMDGQAYFSKNYLIKLVDRVGGGDSFGGGLFTPCARGWARRRRSNSAWPAAALSRRLSTTLTSCLKLMCLR